MMKNVTRSLTKLGLLFAAAGMVLLAGCSKDKIDGALSISPMPEAAVGFTVGADDSYTYTVATDRPSWEVAVTPADAARWCKAAKTADGKGFTLTGTLTLGATNYPEATVIVTAAGASPITFIARVADVYAAGYKAVYGVKYAAFWKNGVAVSLSDKSSYATSVFVSGDDVYVAGNDESDFDSQQPISTLWKNGSRVSLSDKFSYASSVFVSGNDVYVAGYEYVYDDSRAILWKNGVPTSLSDIRSEANAVFVSGNDVYVAGQEYVNKVNRAILWKNGVPTSLSDIGSEAKAVFVSGNDVYVVGIEYTYPLPRAALWKNGVRVYLSVNYSRAYSVFVSGNDVYVAGQDEGNQAWRARLWKNERSESTFVSLSDNFSYATSVFASGNDVYVAEHELVYVFNYNTYRAMLLKNGKAVTFAGDMTSCVLNAVFVK